MTFKKRWDGIVGKSLVSCFCLATKSIYHFYRVSRPSKRPLKYTTFFALPVTHSWVEIIHPLQKQKLRGRRDVTTFQTLGSSQSIWLDCPKNLGCGCLSKKDASVRWWASQLKENSESISGGEKNWDGATMYAIQIHQCPPFICHQNSQLRCTNRHIYLRKPMVYMVLGPHRFLAYEKSSRQKSEFMKKNVIQWTSLLCHQLQHCACSKLNHSPNQKLTTTWWESQTPSQSHKLQVTRKRPTLPKASSPTSPYEGTVNLDKPCSIYCCRILLSVIRFTCTASASKKAQINVWNPRGEHIYIYMVSPSTNMIFYTFEVVQVNFQGISYT